MISSSMYPKERRVENKSAPDTVSTSYKSNEKEGVVTDFECRKAKKKERRVT